MVFLISWSNTLSLLNYVHYLGYTIEWFYCRLDMVMLNGMSDVWVDHLLQELNRFAELFYNRPAELFSSFQSFLKL